MSLIAPYVGEVQLLARLLYATASSENAILHLFSNNITPSSTDTTSTYTEVTSGQLVSFSGLVGGSGYVSAPTVTITAPGGANAVQATATATISGGAITALTITNPGNGYASAPTIGFTGGSGTGASVTATVNSNTNTWYSQKVLTSSQSGSTWSVPSTSGSNTTSTYNSGTPQSWSPTSSQTVYGYFICGSLTNIVWWSEAFASSKNLSNGDTLQLTPKLQLI